MSRTFLIVRLHADGFGLNRVVSMLRRHGVEMRLLSIAETEQPTVVQLSLALEIAPAAARRVAGAVGRLLDVVSVRLLDGSEVLVRQSTLIRLRANEETLGLITRELAISGVGVLAATSTSIVVEVAGEPDAVHATLERLPSGEILEIISTSTLLVQRAEGLERPMELRAERAPVTPVTPVVAVAVEVG